MGVIIALILAAFAIKRSNLFVRQEPNVLLTEGYNFRKIRNSDNSWRGPELGERINLHQLKDSDGKSLAQVVGTPNILLVTLDPECAYCRASGDLINSLSDGEEQNRIEYYPISFARIDDTNDIEQLAMSLGFQSKVFTWANEGEMPQESLQNIVTPAHLLLDNTGKVLQVWAGSSREKEVRKKMGQQILSDINVINDTLKVIAEK